MHFGAGRVADALGVSRQSLGHLASDLLSDRPPRKHHNFTPAEVLWLACFRYARASGLEAWPARVFVGSGGMRLLLEALLDRAAPDPAEAVKRLRNVPLLFGARFSFFEDQLGTHLAGEPLLIEAQRVPAKLTEPCVSAAFLGGNDGSLAHLTTFLTPLRQPLNVLGRLIEENANVAEP